MKTIFLGGTCNKSNWRELLKPLLKINYFDPVVPNWTPADQEREIASRKTSDFVLYTITPRMTGVYSIAEVVDDSNKRPAKTVFLVLPSDTADDGKAMEFDKVQTKSLAAVTKMVRNNGAVVCSTLQEVADYVNAR